MAGWYLMPHNHHLALHFWCKLEDKASKSKQHEGQLNAGVQWAKRIHHSLLHNQRQQQSMWTHCGVSCGRYQGGGGASQDLLSGQVYDVKGLWWQKIIRVRCRHHSMKNWVNMNGIRRKVKLGHLINKHRGLGNKRIPGILADAIASLATLYHRKFEWAMDVSVAVGEIHPTTNRDKMVAQCAFLRCIGRCDEVSIHSAKCWSGMLMTL